MIQMIFFSLNLFVICYNQYMAQLRSLQILTNNQLKMLQFASDVLNVETFNQNGFCGFYLGSTRVVLVEMRGYQKPCSLEVDFEIELAQDDSIDDVIARSQFHNYKNSCLDLSGNSIVKTDSYTQVSDTDQRLWRLYNFSYFSSLQSSQQIINVRMF